ncbi:MAG: hypothetical protein ACI3V5_05600 [Faecousia sp.]
MARDFATDESVKNEGILDVFLVFNTARMWQKIRHSAAGDLFRASLKFLIEYQYDSRREMRLLFSVNSCLLLVSVIGGEAALAPAFMRGLSRRKA